MRVMAVCLLIMFSQGRIGGLSSPRRVCENHGSAWANPTNLELDALWSPGSPTLQFIVLWGPVSVFVRVFLHLLAGEGVWGRGRYLSPRLKQPFRNFFVAQRQLDQLDRGVVARS